MKPSAEIAEEGLRAYEQAGAFERLRGRSGMMILVALCPVFMILIGWVAFRVGYASAGYSFLVGALFNAAFTVWNWRRLRARHTQNLALLARLEKEYGDDLPWLEVERHLAALDRLVADLEQEKSGRNRLDSRSEEDEPTAS